MVLNVRNHDLLRSAGTLPVMGVAFWLMLRKWLGAVDSLADYQVCIFTIVPG